MDGSFESNGFRLASHLKLPALSGSERVPGSLGLILCHGFPINPVDARRSAITYPQLIDRIAVELGMPAMTFNFRGCGDSAGDFSLQWWIDDLRAAIDYMIDEANVPKVILVGTNTGALIAVCVGADDPRVCAAALLSGRAEFDDWADHPRRLLDHAREIGAVRTPGFPRSMDDWSRAFRRFRPTAAAARFAPRLMLVMHGEEDDSVPVNEARQLAESHGAAELSLLTGAGARLRHDPLAAAILMGWAQRMQTG